MTINKLSQNHIGTQPIRVLQYNVLYQFDNTNPKFKELLKKTIKTIGLNPDISYKTNNKPIMVKIDGHNGQIPYVDINNKITIHETFLSYVWCMSYSLLVLHDEAIVKPIKNKKIQYEIDNDKVNKAKLIFNYAISLIHGFSEWDKTNLPNPEKYLQEDLPYIEQANRLFVDAMNFILCHEFAHIEKEHLKKLIVVGFLSSHILKYEKEADKRAIELVLSGVKPKTKLSSELGIIIGLCCILFFSKECKTTDHPATNDRIHGFIMKVNPSSNEAHWGLASLAFILWDNKFEKDFALPQSVNDFKELYELIREEIQRENNVS